jgi:hypothetical protein
MEPRELPVKTGEEAARVVRALGQHRYVASRLHLVHAFAFDAAGPRGPLADATRWARAVLADSALDAASKDERLWRRSSEAEIANVLAAFWGPASGDIHERLRARLDAAEIAVPRHPPFEEEHEDDVFPILVDAGWELVPLAELDPERHKGAILAFGEPILFEAARFDEEAPLERRPYLQELPAIGPVELLAGADAAGALVSPLVLWTEGPDVYHDYVLRGVLRAAKVACQTV